MTDAHSDLDALGAAALDAQDVLVLQRLRALYSTVDPVPDDLVDRIEFEISLDALNAELAELQQLPAQAVGARGTAPDEVTTLTFTSDSLTTMVSITVTAPDRVRIDGWLAPGSPARIELRQVGEQWETQADQDGRFVFEDVPHGLSRFVVQADDAEPAVITPAVEL